MTRKEFRERLGKAFSDVRKKGIVAKENYLCCTTCASDGVDREARRKKSIGGIYWHAQDDELIEKTGALCVGFRANTFMGGQKVVHDIRGSESLPTHKFLNDALSRECEYLALEVARHAVEAFKTEGLSVDWNGRGSQRIEVSIPGRKRREGRRQKAKK